MDGSQPEDNVVEPPTTPWEVVLKTVEFPSVMGPWRVESTLKRMGIDTGRARRRYESNLEGRMAAKPGEAAAMSA